jgi:hypothetical protein
LEENKGKIKSHENRTVKIEKEAEDVLRQQRERDAEFKQQIEEGRSEVTKELDIIGKEMRDLKQEVKTQVGVSTTGTPTLTQLSAKGGLPNETVPLQLEETISSGMYKGVQGLVSGEFPLPTFDENAGVNPVSHLRQLEEIFRFRGVQQKHWLTVAKRSITGSMSKKGLEATSTKFTNDEQFKKEFLAT